MGEEFIKVTRPRREDLDNMQLNELTRLVSELETIKQKRMANRNANRNGNDDDDTPPTLPDDTPPYGPLYPL